MNVIIKRVAMRFSFLSGIVRAILILSSSVFCFAQNKALHFNHLTADDGLSHTYVRCIVQDDQGFMWFGTFDGLNKYDGYQFTVYRHHDNDPYSIPNNIIRSLYKDSQNRLWIGTSRGLCFYDRDYDRIIRFDEENGCHLGNMSIDCIFEDGQKNLWVGTVEQGLFLIDPVHFVHVQYHHDDADPNSLGNDNIKSIFEDSRGLLWIGTVGGGADLFDRNNKTFTHFVHRHDDPQSILGNEIYAITEDQDGYLWFACYGDGLSCIHSSAIETRAFTHYRPQKQGLRDPWARFLLSDKDGGLWIGTENGGLDYLDRDRRRFTHYENEANNPQSLNNNSIYSLCRDTNGSLWIGTYAGGINLVHPSIQAFITYQNIPGQTHSLSANSVWEFAEDREGYIWIATDGGGLNRFDPQKKTFESFSSKNTNLNKDAVLSVCVDSQDDVWIGAWEGGLSRLDRKTRSFRAFTSANTDLSNDNIFDIAEDGKGNLWVSSQHGFNKFIKKEERFIPYTIENSRLRSNFIEVIRTDCFGNVLLGTLEGFSIFDPETETFTDFVHDSKDKNSLSNDFVTSIWEEDSLTLWIATTYGLNKLNRKTHEITRYNTTDGLPSDLVYGIEKERNGCYWVSTNKGLSRFDPRTNFFRNYSKNDGLQSDVFIKKSHLLSNAGEFYFGGVSGFNAFDPGDIVDNRVIPPVVITDFQIFNRPVPVHSEDSPLTKQIGQMEELVLSHKTSVFSFGFAALNYIIPSKNQYAYILEGFDKEWNYVGTRRLATYTNLDPGKYVFRVKGSNNDGLWNEKGASIRIVITPPFWKRWWFRLGVVLALGLLILGGYEFRLLQMRQQRLLLATQVLEKTQNLKVANEALEHQKTFIQNYADALKRSNDELEAFSYSVSHDLRAPLRAMDGFSQALLEDYEEKFDEDGRDYLRRIRAGSQHMGRLIDDLLKLSRLTRSQMHFQTVDLSWIVESVAEDFRQKDPERKVEFIIEKNVAVKGDPSLLKVMVWNLMDNAWKFTSRKPESRIEFGTRQENGKEIHFFKDNGVGFDMNYSARLFEAFQRQHTDYEGTGIGLTTVQRIIHRHGGRIWAEGKENVGATFYFTL